ncbi:MerR family transcriptional regulator [Anaerocolumna cellulosilytica]|uniref:MerR family transcriptional regulator n=1 Tax=Anaerocolumna cellulosilytica TaxID=433286 RepID=A0A6S6R3C6_9FIRM|nr:MerR family transcriptional regulator [Anaerocolumna cellulosilytica]MBB5195616.1 DNA-binding transcriptional MerR regulator [Anaerocolumna cellulosilytica]BCJ93860.1 MerR family transcriptional regulator [Anaerocolumna cellulosilytica]
MKTYKTSEIAKSIGIHPNTVRLYEKLELIPTPKRKANGYRIFTDFHIEQIKLTRTALQVEVLQNGLRKQVIAIIKTSASGNFNKAIELTKCYLQQIKNEIRNAEEAIEITEQLFSDTKQGIGTICLTRKETADYLQISMDALRNWEMNGLLTIKRKQNGYRVYTDEDIKRLKIIRSLRLANYSLSAILRMLCTLSQNPDADIRQIIDTPQKNDTIISVCDRLLTSLHYAEKNAITMLGHLENMNKQFTLNPPL